MIKIEFNYNQVITNIQAKVDVPFKDVINKYTQKSSLEPDSLNFLVNGRVINPNESVENYMSNLDKRNKKMKILVTTAIKDEPNKEDIIVKSREIICTTCKEPCRITIDNYKIKLFECVNNHISKNIKLIDFDDTQKVNESQIICDQCKFKNKGNCPKNEFYRCLTCKMNLCLLCKSNHNPKDNIILYDQRNYICQTHNEPIIKYCKEHKKNICFACEEHEEHESVFLGNIKPNIEEKKKILNEFKINIDSINKTIKEIIDKLNRFTQHTKNCMK